MNPSRAMFAVAVFVGLAGCTGTPKRLVAARQAYQEAVQGPAAQLSPSKLEQSRQYLDTANTQFKTYGDVQAVRDNAYVAQRTAQIADARARAAHNRAMAAHLRSAQEALVGARAREQVLEQKLAAMQKTQATELAAVPENEEKLPPPKLEEGAPPMVVTRREGAKEVVTLSSFQSGEDSIPGPAMPALDRMANQIKTLGDGQSATIVGFTDTVGPEAFNQDLSLRRATAVRDALVSRGVPAEKLKIEGKGEAEPLVGDETPVSLPINRRVEISIPVVAPSVS